MRLNLTQHGEPHQVRTPLGLTDCELFLDSVEGGAWPFLVRGLVCLVNSVNERELCLPIGRGLGCRVVIEMCESYGLVASSEPKGHVLLQGTVCRFKLTEERVNSRSVMLLNVLGCTRTTMIKINECSSANHANPGPMG